MTTKGYSTEEMRSDYKLCGEISVCCGILKKLSEVIINMTTKYLVGK